MPLCLSTDWQRVATFEKRLEYIRYQELFGWTCCLQSGRDDPGCVLSLPSSSSSSSFFFFLLGGKAAAQAAGTVTGTGTVTLEEMFRRCQASGGRSIGSSSASAGSSEGEYHMPDCV